MFFSRFCIAFSALVVFVVFITGRKISKTQWNTDAAFYCIAKDAILDEIAIFKNITNDIIDCIDFCVSVAVCKAINTHVRSDGKLDCHLLQEDHMTKSSKVISKAGWRLYDTGSSDTNSAVGSTCSAKSSNPCSEGCACVASSEGHRCDCGEKEIFKSCKDALHQNHMAELHYLIKGVNMSEAVYVKCTKNSDGFYVALFDHKNEIRAKVTNYESCASYKQKLDYSPNKMADIAAYIATAASCKQHTKIECYGTSLLYKNCGYPLSRSGSMLNYWGGGPTDGSGGCACGITKTCSNNAYKCNCDANRNYIKEVDQGYMTDKSVLPISEVRFGDTGASYEYLHYTLGKLECTEH